MAFEATPEMMAVIANEINGKIQEWDNAVKTLYSQVDELVSMTSGKTTEALKTRMSNDQQKFSALSALMVEYSNAIVEIGKLYTEGDVSGETIIKK